MNVSSITPIKELAALYGKSSYGDYLRNLVPNASAS